MIYNGEQYMAVVKKDTGFTTCEHCAFEGDPVNCYKAPGCTKQNADRQIVKFWIWVKVK